MHSYDHGPVNRGLEALRRLPAVVAEGFEDWGEATSSPPERSAKTSCSAPQTFRSEQEYHFCKTVIEHPLQPSSTYPKLAEMSPKTARPIRRRLVELGFIRELSLDRNTRGRTAILLEALPAAVAAVAQYEARARS